MAMTIHPVDGLIQRLLQQSSRPGKTGSDVSSSNSFPLDQVQISGDAHHQARLSGNAPSRLEDQLLQMYTRHGHVS